MHTNLRLQREQASGHHHMPTLDEHRAGPDKNASLPPDALEPLDGTVALDFACETGITTAWLAERGPDVLGIDTTPPAISCTQMPCEELGINANFRCGQITGLRGPASGFQRIPDKLCQFSFSAVFPVPFTDCPPLITQCPPR